MENQSIFEKLNKIDVKDKIEKKNGLSYLSWAWAWAELKKLYPLANYKIYETETGCIYWDDGETAWVKTGVIVNDLEHIEYLPIMDFRNKSIPLENITSFDVNKAIQRSLTKAVARHGLGLYIYAGEDLPENGTTTTTTTTTAEPIKKQEVEEVLEKNIEGKIERCEEVISAKGTPYFKVQAQGEVFSVFGQKDLKEGLKIKTRLVKNGKFWNSRDFEVIENIIEDNNEDLDLEIPF
ncbi:DUF1071 domain-containing protein [bacterium]|nr:DUF1071 domain-containing protein [bacterium]